jgi:hypothetical protein
MDSMESLLMKVLWKYDESLYEDIREVIEYTRTPWL